MLNGSPRINGNTSIALKELEKVFKEYNIETETVQVGNKAVRGCIACGHCFENQQRTIADDMFFHVISTRHSA